MSSTETTRGGERGLYNDTKFGKSLAIEYSGLKLHDVVGLSESNVGGNEHAVEEKVRNMRVYHVEFSWYRLYDLISQSGSKMDTRQRRRRPFRILIKTHRLLGKHSRCSEQTVDM